MKKAIIIGSSDGIGLGLAKRLLEENWQVTGLSRSSAKFSHENYHHHIIDVQNDNYAHFLEGILAQKKLLDLCVYCPGVGTLLDLAAMHEDVVTFNVNLMGMVHTVSSVIPLMDKQGSGHFIGLSSLADEMLSVEAPAYHASKAGFSNYLEGLALHLKPKDIHITNVRFGFVDTKMAKGDIKPFMISVDNAVDHLMKCIQKRPIRYTAPKITIPMVKFRRWMLKLQVMTSKAQW